MTAVTAGFTPGLRVVGEDGTTGGMPSSGGSPSVAQFELPGGNNVKYHF